MPFTEGQGGKKGKRGKGLRKGAMGIHREKIVGHMFKYAHNH